MDNLLTKIGYLIGGSLKDNLIVRLEVSPEEVQEGAFVVLESGNWQFYGIVTDFLLGSTDPRFADERRERLPQNLARLLRGQTLYTNLNVLTTLMLERGPEPGTDEYNQWMDDIEAGKRLEPRPRPVKTIPHHHAEIRLAGEGDIAEVFGKPSGKDNFVIGYTREQNHPVCLNLEKFVKRSSGVFGATGTGKSFLTRIILAGLINHNQTSVLVLDMHNEYGFDSKDSDTGANTIGLKTKFHSQVNVVGLGRRAMIGGLPPDFNLEIAMQDILPEDIKLLTRELNLTETTPVTLSALVKSFGSQRWFSEFKEMKTGKTIQNEDGKTVPAPDSVEAWAHSEGVHPEAAKGLHSKLRLLFDKDYILEKPAADSVYEIIKALEAGKHVVLSFGNFESDLDYLFVSNILTRRIRHAWEKRTNQFRTGKEDEPRPLVVVVEEAHKLLNREMASQTIFNTIARELRKYYVTLLIVDQRPSQIYDEVMSQLGTRISGWLGDQDDIHSVLSGLAGRASLRGMLSHLQPKEEVLLTGWGVPMPLPVRSRRYDIQFWNELLGKKKRDEKQLKEELGF